MTYPAGVNDRPMMGLWALEEGYSLSARDEFVLEGVKTSIPFRQQLLMGERFRAGDFDTKFLERFEIVPPEAMVTG